jgi:hypothetical protein
MQRQHPKLAVSDIEKIKNNESLLSDADRLKVDEIRFFVGDLQNRLLPKIHQLSQLEAQRAQIDNQRVALDQERDEGLVDAQYAERVAHLDQQDEQLREPYYALSDEVENLRNQLNNQIESFKKEHKYEFEIDENLNLIKIARARNPNASNLNDDQKERAAAGSNGPAFSVLFVKSGPETLPVILYRGKENKLGEGGEGKVKLAQNYHDSKLVAIKIQPPSDQEALQKQKAMLGEQLRGELARAATPGKPPKDYIVMDLIYGQDMDKIIKDQAPPERLDNLSKAAQVLQAFHDSGRIHRDVKPENFMWDKDYGQAHLIDYSFVEQVNGGADLAIEDEAGSPNYRAAEKYPEEQHVFSKKTDIYAFGVMAQTVLQQDPQLYQIMKADIDAMIGPKANRPENLNAFISKLELTKDQIAKQELKGSHVKGLIHKFSHLQEQAAPVVKSPSIAHANYAKPSVKKLKEQYEERIKKEGIEASKGPKPKR